MKKLFGLRELKFFVGLIMVVGGLVGMVYSASIPADWNNIWLFVGSVTFTASVTILGLTIAEKAWMGVKR